LATDEYAVGPMDDPAGSLYWYFPQASSFGLVDETREVVTATDDAGRAQQLVPTWDGSTLRSVVTAPRDECSMPTEADIQIRRVLGIESDVSLRLLSFDVASTEAPTCKIRFGGARSLCPKVYGQKVPYWDAEYSAVELQNGMWRFTIQDRTTPPACFDGGDAGIVAIKGSDTYRQGIDDPAVQGAFTYFQVVVELDLGAFARTETISYTLYTEDVWRYADRFWPNFGDGVHHTAYALSEPGLFKVDIVYDGQFLDNIHLGGYVRIREPGADTDRT
jgi:hypothetical protein